MAKPPYPRARKRFGQHFLEPAWVTRLVNLVDPRPEDMFLEIGPGRGALTRVLAPRAGRVIAIEIDRDLAAALPATVPSNVTVIQGDFLELNLESGLADLLPREAGVLRDARPTDSAGRPRRDASTVDSTGASRDDRLDGDLSLRVIGNLPYNISSPILFKLITAADGGRRVSDATLMLQKEVVDRITAEPGSGDYGTLAIQVAPGGRRGATVDAAARRFSSASQGHLRGRSAALPAAVCGRRQSRHVRTGRARDLPSAPKDTLERIETSRCCSGAIGR